MAIDTPDRPTPAVAEAELVAALKAGEDAAFETLVRTSSQRLLAVARRFARTEEDAQDIVQTAYLNAFLALEKFEGQAQLSTWLHRIVVNTALTKLRTQRTKPEESIETLLPRFKADGHHVEQFLDWSAPADVLVERSETRAVVRRCIAELPEAYRTVLLLRDIEERSTREVADALDLSMAAVKTRLHRARQSLATRLRQQFGGAGATPDDAAASNG
ncbi:MAG: sigma-70 family RNA polymerase sigma factor [Acidobacteria bacterium]|nr:sigma-70 family RNA polymerase sigma factor [Acidobacteriota bacterium]